MEEIRFITQGPMQIADRAATDKAKRRESARLYVAMQSMPAAVLRLLTAEELITVFGIGLSIDRVTVLKREYLKREGMMKRGRGEDKQEVDQLNRIGHQLTLERIANVISKSYVHLGDDEKVASEDALTLIKRELTRFDPAIVTRNEKRALPR